MVVKSALANFYEMSESRKYCYGRLIIVANTVTKQL